MNRRTNARASLGGAMIGAWVMAAAAAMPERGDASGSPATPVAHAPSSAGLAEVTLAADDTRIDRSCRIMIPPGLRLHDAAGDGLIIVTAPGVTIEFAPGSLLDGRGTPAQTAAEPGPPEPDAYAGVGVRVSGHRDVTIRGLHATGLRVGVLADRADGLKVLDARFDDLWRQRLRSTPQEEDARDWLWPHENDADEWVTRYGAMVSVRESEGVELARIQGRRGQNGLLLSRVRGASVYNNDCSFLSGWGLALWRSDRNTIAHNRFDFCIRGYAHGVYHRGQDSAGILLFEQCSGNLIASNSATHGGDGLFVFAGREALGQRAGAPDVAEPGRHTRLGCNDNLIVGNTFSDAAAHGAEITFSFGNRLIGNTFARNAITGLWGGYSQHTLVRGNTFTANGLASARTLSGESGGVNIEHGVGNVIAGNVFEGNSVGVRLWLDDDPALATLPWSRDNLPPGTDGTRQRIEDNRFNADMVGVRLDAMPPVSLTGNRFAAVATPTLERAPRPAGALPAVASATDPARGPEAGTAPARDEHEPLPGVPLGPSLRDALAGREHIMMTEWGPWDHQSPMLRLIRDDEAIDTYELRQLPDGELDVTGQGAGVTFSAAAGSEPGQTLILQAAATRAGVWPYSATITIGDWSQRAAGVVVSSRWEVVVFPYQGDPRDDVLAWREQAEGPEAVSLSLDALRLPFGHGGPGALTEVAGSPVPDAPRRGRIGADRFGVLAGTVLPLTPGRYRLTVTSDDGVRVRLRTGPASTDGLRIDQPAITRENAARLAFDADEPGVLIERWTQHGPTRDSGVFTVLPRGTAGASGPAPADAANATASVPLPVEVLVEYFELDGFATLRLDLEPEGAPAAEPTPR